MSNPELVIHRINTVAGLRAIPRNFGLEIDLRAQGSDLILNHEPFLGGDRFIDWLDQYQHGLLVLNIKEAGIEAEVLRLVRSRGVKDFFLLDVEFPYLYRASRKGEKAIAVRYSEDEPIELVERYKASVDWVWVDTNTCLPVDASIAKRLNGIKTCLVCPERWGRPHDIIPYRRQMAACGFSPDAVMTSMAHVVDWTAPL